MLVYIDTLWSYYLVQIWPSRELLSGTSKAYYLVQVNFWPVFTVVSGDVCTLTYDFVFWSGRPIISQFSKNLVFFQIGCISTNFTVLYFMFENNLFMFAKTRKIGGAADFCGLLFKEKNKAKNKKAKKKLEILVCCFVQKWPFRDRCLLFKKLVCWNPCFDNVFGVRAFWARLSKREILDPTPKNLTGNWKAHFFVFFGFLFLCFFLLFFFVFCFLEGLRVRFWATSLGAKPSLLVLVCFFRWSGPKGHLT